MCFTADIQIEHLKAPFVAIIATVKFAHTYAECITFLGGWEHVWLIGNCTIIIRNKVDYVDLRLRILSEAMLLQYGFNKQ